MKDLIMLKIFVYTKNLTNEVRDNFKGLADIERSLTRISAGLVN